MAANLVVVDYGAGNLTSVANALCHIGENPIISSSAQVVENADRLVFPGVGAAGSAMDTLKRTGLADAIINVVKKGNPVLGICIGCQIILESSEEDSFVKTLGILSGRAVRFKDEPLLKIPHMGWNQVHFVKEHPIFSGIKNDSDFYFVHSYHPQVSHEFAFATTSYGMQTFPSAIGKDNLIATQFHLEKSGALGLQVLKNFCHWNA